MSANQSILYDDRVFGLFHRPWCCDTLKWRPRAPCPSSAARAQLHTAAAPQPGARQPAAAARREPLRRVHPCACRMPRPAAAAAHVCRRVRKVNLVTACNVPSCGRKGPGACSPTGASKRARGLQLPPFRAEAAGFGVAATARAAWMCRHHVMAATQRCLGNVTAHSDVQKGSSARRARARARGGRRRGAGLGGARPRPACGARQLQRALLERSGRPFKPRAALKFRSRCAARAVRALRCLPTMLNPRCGPRAQRRPLRRRAAATRALGCWRISRHRNAC